MSVVHNDIQVLNKCQLGDEASKKEGKLDSIGQLHMTLQHYSLSKLQSGDRTLH